MPCKSACCYLCLFTGLQALSNYYGCHNTKTVESKHPTDVHSWIKIQKLVKGWNIPNSFLTSKMHILMHIDIFVHLGYMPS